MKHCATSLIYIYKNLGLSKNLFSSTSLCLIGWSLSLFSRFENLKGTHESFIDTHHGPSIVEFTTIIGSGKKSYELAPGKEFISVFYDLRFTREDVCISTFLVSSIEGNEVQEKQRHTIVLWALKLELIAAGATPRIFGRPPKWAVCYPSVVD